MQISKLTQAGILCLSLALSISGTQAQLPPPPGGGGGSGPDIENEDHIQQNQQIVNYISTGQIPSVATSWRETSGSKIALTWDGLVAIKKYGFTYDKDTNDVLWRKAGWYAQVILYDEMTKDANDVVEWRFSNMRPGTSIPWGYEIDDKAALEFDLWRLNNAADGYYFDPETKTLGPAIQQPGSSYYYGTHVKSSANGGPAFSDQTLNQATGMDRLQNKAVHIDPAWPSANNPYFSDDQGNEVTSGTAGYVTYRFRMITGQVLSPISGDPDHPNSARLTYGFRRGMIVVKLDTQAMASGKVKYLEVEKAAFTDYKANPSYPNNTAYTRIDIDAAEYAAMSAVYPNAEPHLHGFEPTSTIDGGLMCFNGLATNDGINNVVCSYPMCDHKDPTCDISKYHYPFNVSELYSRRNDPHPFCSGGTSCTIGERYPLANYPMVAGDGEAIGNARTPLGSPIQSDPVFGAYSWLFPEGEGIVTVPNRGTNQLDYESSVQGGKWALSHCHEGTCYTNFQGNFYGGRRSGISYVGEFTYSNGAYAITQLDTLQNDSFRLRGSVNSFGIGLYNGPWSPITRLDAETQNNFKIRGERDVFALITTGSGPSREYQVSGANLDHGNDVKYHETSVTDNLDGDYLLSSGLNPITAYEDPSKTNFVNTWDESRDNSGNGLKVELYGAFYPQLDFPDNPNATVHASNGGAGYERDRGIGRLGQAPYCSNASKILISEGAQSRVGTLGDYDKELTIEFWMSRLNAATATNITLSKGPSHEVRIDGDTVKAIFKAAKAAGGTQNITATSETDLDPNNTGFYHVAATFSTNANNQATANLFINGVQVISMPSVNTGITGLDKSAGGDWTFCADAGGSTVPNLILDEIKISRVERTLKEIKTSAQIRKEHQGQLGSLGALAGNIPLGIDPAEIYIPSDNTPTAEKITLGKRMFFDTSFSVATEGNQKVSCASCHRPDAGFGDVTATSQGSTGLFGDLKANRITNLALARPDTNFFWNGRAATLEEQVIMPISNPIEMNSSIANVKAAIAAQAASYNSEIAAAFPGYDATNITTNQIKKSLASFVRSLLAGNSKVDQYMAGNAGALGPTEKNGLGIFMNKGLCLSCHSGSNYTDNQFHNIGKSSSVTVEDRMAVNNRIRDFGAFRTPSLRDVTRSNFFFRDGEESDLLDVIDHYSDGGEGLPGQDVMIKRLNLTTSEKSDLRDFLNALLSNDYPVVTDPWKK